MKKLLVLVALTMVMFTGCGSEKNTEVVDVKESAPVVVTESGTVAAPTDFVPSTNGAGAAAKAAERLLRETKSATVDSFVDNYMVDLCEAYDLSAANDFAAVKDVVFTIAYDALNLIEEDLKSITDMEEVVAALNSKLEEYVTVDKVINSEDFVIRNLTSISGSSTPVIEESAPVETSAPVEEDSNVVYKDAVDACVVEFLTLREAGLPESLDSITIKGACMTDSEYVIEVVFSDSTGTEYFYDMTGLHEYTDNLVEEAANFEVEDCLWVLYND